MKRLKILFLTAGLIVNVTDVTQTMHRETSQQEANTNRCELLNIIERAIQTAPTDTDLHGLDTFIHKYQANTLPDDHDLSDFDAVAEQLNIKKKWAAFKNIVSEKCSVCMNEVLSSNFAKTLCNHNFCKPCLNNWLTNHSTCPTCRADINLHSKIENAANSHGDINTYTINGLTLLYQATTNDDALAVQKILDLKPNINAFNNGGTALHQAICNGNIIIIQKLLSAGADIHAHVQDDIKDTGIHIAASQGQAHTFNILLAAGADINALNTHKKTPLHLAVEEERIESVKELIKHHADVSITDNEAQTALCIATKNNFIDIVRELVNSTQNSIEAVDSFGYTALHWAAYKNYTDIIEILINAHANINARDYQRYTPLHWATNQSNKEAVETLLINGADKTLKTINGQTASEISITTNTGPAISLLLETPQEHLLHLFVYNKNKTCTQQLLTKKINIDAIDSNGFTALHYAAQIGETGLIQDLITAGANKTIPNNEGKTTYDLFAETLTNETNGQEILNLLRP